MEDVKGFFGSLFDLRFKNFITPKLISVLYILMLIGNAAGALFVIIGAFSESFGYGLLRFIIGIVGFVILMILARVLLEVTIVLFKIEENTRKSNAQG